MCTVRNKGTGKISHEIMAWRFIRMQYEKVVKLLIRPPRSQYSIEDLGDRVFDIVRLYPPKQAHKITKIERTDLRIKNLRNMHIVASHWVPVPKSEEPGTHAGVEEGARKAPCVLYLHGNSSCRLAVLRVLHMLLQIGVTVCAMDFTGSGGSEGEYVSLGHHESRDVKAVVDYLQVHRNVGKLGIWGFSMGAATTLLYSSNMDNRVVHQCSAVVADSPFMSLTALCEDLLSKSASSLNHIIISQAISMVSDSVRYRAGFDIADCSPIDWVPKSTTPTMFVHGEDDKFIAMAHSQKLHGAHGAPVKDIKIIKGDHTSPRPLKSLIETALFFHWHLCREETTAGRKTAKEEQRRGVSFDADSYREMEQLPLSSVLERLAERKLLTALPWRIRISR